MSKTSEIDPYWIASMYHNGKTMAEFVQALHDVGLTKDESTILWRIIDAAIDIQPDRDTKAHRAEPERAPNNARDAICPCFDTWTVIDHNGDIMKIKMGSVLKFSRP